MSILTNKGKEAISTAISSSSQFSLVRIGFGDKQGSIYRKFVESDTSLVNEKFRINLDSVYYLPTVDNNTILKITANLTPEQSATMEAVTVREFGIYDNFNNLLIVGDTVPTITKDSNNNNGIDFEINLTLPTSEKVARVLVTSKEGEFSNAERIKLNNIEEGATKNNTDSFLLDRKNHTGKIDIENVDGLVTILDSLETVDDNDDKLSGKVDKVTGKGLSTNDYTDMEKDKLNSIDVESLEKVVNDVTELKSDFNTLVIKEELFVTLEDYVIKVPGKELSSNDYTDMEKNKLASIDIGNIYNNIFDLEKRPYFMGSFQDEDEMLSLFFYDGYEEDDKKPIYNDMYYYNIGLNSVMYYNGGTWIKGNNLNIVDDLNSTLPIGAILNGYTIFPNCIVAFGGVFNRADYPKLWTYLQANPSLVKTDAEWQTEVTANGGICGFYSNGNGSTTFRAPSLIGAFLRPDSRSIASYQADTFKSHTHESAKFYQGGFGTGSSNNLLSLGSSAGVVVSTNPTGGTETRPKNIAVLPLIVAK